MNVYICVYVYVYLCIYVWDIYTEVPARLAAQEILTRDKRENTIFQVEISDGVHVTKDKRRHRTKVGRAELRGIQKYNPGKDKLCIKQMIPLT